jgi:hypothetical protein
MSASSPRRTARVVIVVSVKRSSRPGRAAPSSSSAIHARSALPVDVACSGVGRPSQSAAMTCGACTWST